MKLPSLNTAEGIVVLAAAAAAAYVVYRMSTAASSIGSTVSSGIGSVGSGITSLLDDANVAINKARTSSVGASPAAPGDQTDAETARLNRQSGLTSNAQAAPAFPITQAPYISPPVLGQAQTITTPQVPDSGDNSGLTGWSLDQSYSYF